MSKQTLNWEEWESFTDDQLRRLQSSQRKLLMNDKHTQSYDWIRDNDGRPKRMSNGGFVMQRSNGACFKFTDESLPMIRKLLDEMEEL